MPVLLFLIPNGGGLPRRRWADRVSGVAWRWVATRRGPGARHSASQSPSVGSIRHLLSLVRRLPKCRCPCVIETLQRFTSGKSPLAQSLCPKMKSPAAPSIRQPTALRRIAAGSSASPSETEVSAYERWQSLSLSNTSSVVAQSAICRPKSPRVVTQRVGRVLQLPLGERGEMESREGTFSLR